MTPLEAAREIQRMTQAVHDRSLCSFCNDPEKVCAWKGVPKIVAALEAAAAFVAVNGKDETSMDALMRAEDNLHAAFGDKRRYQDGSQN